MIGICSIIIDGKLYLDNRMLDHSAILDQLKQLFVC